MQNTLPVYTHKRKSRPVRETPAAALQRNLLPVPRCSTCSAANCLSRFIRRLCSSNHGGYTILTSGAWCLQARVEDLKCMGSTLLAKMASKTEKTDIRPSRVTSKMTCNICFHSKDSRKSKDEHVARAISS